MKPHRGTINDWRKHPVVGEAVQGYIILGEFVDHPRFMGKRGHTSLVLQHDGDEIETLNSRYTLGTPAAPINALNENS